MAVGRVDRVAMSAPRLVTGRHPRAAGTYGDAALAYAAQRPGMHTRRWAGPRDWQAYALRRALEHDAGGELLWSTVILSAPRQVGKSYVERVVCSWRQHAAELFGEPQDVLHLAHKLTAAQEVWRPAARMEAGRGERVRWANGEQMIELDDGSRWLVQAANDGAGVAFSLSMVLVDEAWRVARHVVDAAVAPTLAEASNPQLWLVSTAGTASSDLMLAYRQLALDTLDPAADSSVLLLEWSAPPDENLDLDDPAVWRAASPYWDDRRAARVREARERSDEWQFRQQWLNQWIPNLSAPLFDTLAWAANAWAGGFPDGPLAFGFDVAPDRSHSSIVAHVGGVAEVVDDRPGAGWVAQRIGELCASWRPVAVGYDATGPAAAVGADLAGHDEVADLLVALNGRDLANASGLLFDAITAGEVVATRESTTLAAAVGAARRRSYGQSWVFARDSITIALLALTAARWAGDHAPSTLEASAIW